MAVITMEIASRQPFADGIAFGEHGAYEQIEGTVRFAVDPTHEGGAGDRRPGQGQTRCGRPGPLRGRLLHPPARRPGSWQPPPAVRGDQSRATERDAPVQPRPLGPPDVLDPGDGFLMRHGWTVGWCGWQWDVFPAPGLLGLEGPQALEGGRSRGRIAVEFQPSALSANKLLANRVHRPYPVADVNDPEAELSVRDWPGGARTRIPREQWAFAG